MVLCLTNNVVLIMTYRICPVMLNGRNIALGLVKSVCRRMCVPRGTM